MVNPQEIVLSCPGCGRKFRISVDEGVLLDHPVPCPSCKTDILTNEQEKPSLKSVFKRSHTPRVVEAQDPRQETPGRRFQDVTKVAIDRSRLPRQTDLAKQIPKKVEPHKALAPLPESSRPSPRVKRVNIKAPATSQSEKETALSQTSPRIPEEIEPKPVEKEKPPIFSFEIQDLDNGLALRHEGDEEVFFDKGRVKQLIRSRTWLGAFEAKIDDRWIPLLQHPAIPMLEKELRSEAKIAMVTISQEFERFEVQGTDTEGEIGVAAIKKASKPSKLAYVLPIFVGFIVGAIYIYSQFTGPEVPRPVIVEIPPPQSAIDASIRVQSVAKNISFSASSFRQKSRDTLIEMSNQSLAKSNFGDALDTLYELERRDPTDSMVVEKLVQSYLGTGGFRDARRAVIRLVVLEGKTKKSEKLFQETLQRDPSLKPEIVEIGTETGLDIDMIKKLGGGKSISFKFKKNGKNAYAFKPSQFEWEDGWEGEVAAFMFCEIATCGFRVPRSRTAKISYKNFFRLYPMGTASQKSYAKRFESLRWKTEKVDGENVKYLYGVLKNWVPRMVDWPIEYTDLWSGWLNPEVPIQTQSAAFAELGLLKQKNRLMWRKLRRDMNVPVGLVAGELSNVLSFDFLSNNWDRFSEKEDFYGVNNQFSDGHFLSLDNGAAFGLRHSSRVKKRFQNVGRFSRTFVASVRICDSKVDAYLFPSQTKVAKKKLVFFHERRLTFLKHISAALKNNEKNNILRFE